VSRGSTQLFKTSKGVKSLRKNMYRKRKSEAQAGKKETGIQLGLGPQIGGWGRKLKKEKK